MPSASDFALGTLRGRLIARQAHSVLKQQEVCGGFGVFFKSNFLMSFHFHTEDAAASTDIQFAPDTDSARLGNNTADCQTGLKKKKEY